MDQPDSQHAPDSVVGMSKGDATDALVAADDSRDPEFVEAILGHVTDDGVVTEDAIDETVADASMVLSTAETRVELAQQALEDATATAKDVSGVDTVRSRLDTFESTVSALDAHVTDLGASIQSLSGWRNGDGDLYGLVTGLRDVTSEAQTVTRVADDTQLDLEQFERWVSSHDWRRDELDADVDALEQSLDDLACTCEELSTTDDGRLWFDAMLRRHVVSLLVADVRAELADLRELADRNDVDADGLDEIADRLDELDDRTTTLGDELDSLAQATWQAQFEDRLTSFREGLDEFEPPVSWGDVQSELEQRRPDVGQ
ncbi:halo transducer protein [Haloferax sp. MBLA0076]|uniref:Halo transducer protein n=1 Tax=Haloferax litoreum TaxID=2666140 RepID=A0A6A8GF10_9EURY|nr:MULTISPECIES: halo transducer protein [Haloferax]KAB1192999.1 halo transducer protein [Haloferax sp. CBA1148]MRX21489.1 halo transducer protein [Haloferax litoreum]